MEAGRPAVRKGARSNALGTEALNSPGTGKDVAFREIHGKIRGGLK